MAPPLPRTPTPTHPHSHAPPLPRTPTPTHPHSHAPPLPRTPTPTHPHSHAPPRYIQHRQGKDTKVNLYFPTDSKNPLSFFLLGPTQKTRWCVVPVSFTFHLPDTDWLV
uniref:Uncharacterized protein n=1 Tax=Human herpesvirus 1 TaxID=10298 RepID=A0A2Z4GZ18_HHV1|nr:hypothetical protein [Human alphaherpesvirus 1]AWW07826.1 hypothetical protein [Human alphaherpesvirus 1]AWW09644.1 hypothetical protein [Human alphaherpesvirus 1]AWW11937.1 hypothetical protein [Human alphaherpesvirus 1]AWW12274.1 hypothetical protein [Human alphaherpesvirus 1]